jgi:hypothetical protein
LDRQSPHPLLPSTSKRLPTRRCWDMPPADHARTRSPDTDAVVSPALRSARPPPCHNDSSFSCRERQLSISLSAVHKSHNGISLSLSTHPGSRIVCWDKQRPVPPRLRSARPITSCAIYGLCPFGGCGVRSVGLLEVSHDGVCAIAPVALMLFRAHMQLQNAEYAVVARKTIRTMMPDLPV